MRLKEVSVALVVGGRESRPHGEGPQPVGSLVATLLAVKAWESSPMPAERERGSKSNRRSPCAVKTARTVTTGGMERRIKGYRALSLPTSQSPPAAPLWILLNAIYGVAPCSAITFTLLTLE